MEERILTTIGTIIGCGIVIIGFVIKLAPPILTIIALIMLIKYLKKKNKDQEEP